jgi:hypothetical protein
MTLHLKNGVPQLRENRGKGASPKVDSERMGNASPETAPAIQGCLPLIVLLGIWGPVLAVAATAAARSFDEDVNINCFYKSTQCVVLNKRISIRSSGSIKEPQLLIRYTVAGEAIESWTYDRKYNLRLGASQERLATDVLNQYNIGGHYTCWFDPRLPHSSVLTRIFYWPLYLIAIAVICGGLVPVLNIAVTVLFTLKIAGNLRGAEK